MEVSGKFEFFRIFHRVIVFFIALWYVWISVKAFEASINVLRGFESKDLGVVIHRSTLIASYAGSASINDSPLVKTVLKGSTELRDDTLFLESATTQSFTGCTQVDGFDATVYSNTFLRFMFASIQEDATYNLTYLTELELIAPVVDCTFDLLASSDKTVDYQVAQQYQSGAGMLLTIAAIDDIQATDVTHHFATALNYPYEAKPQFVYSELKGVEDDNFWLLETIPPAGSINPVKEVRSARRMGGYIDDPIAQSNIEIVSWNLPSDPATELTNWEWHALASLHDSWAWTHSIHGIFAIDVLFDLSVLFFVIYHRLRQGHLWVGDAFATISNALLYRGVLVFVSNHLNGYWTFTEFCLAIGNGITGRRTVHYRPELVHADLLTFFLNVTSILSYLFRERIDPVLAFSTFELGFSYRVELAGALVALKTIIVDFAESDHWLGLVQVSPFLARLSPMMFWTVHAIDRDRKPVVFSTMVAIFSTMTVLVVYIVARKAYRRRQRKKGFISGSSRRNLYNMDPSEKEQMTSFETATGAALSRRFGVISGYDNYVIRDDKHFASIDAVYGNGYLLANHKYLVATEDMLSLLLMKLTRVRFTNIYVYEIVADGGVKQTAQLVYPQTIPWSDLTHLGVAKLS
ncbi:hypothetical protein JM18_008319 [Phytophthora kernoviae]|uniref:Transmembrane protein n=2 Tax=Phytophthora kernoviae TaxID=325452 RepID=A0A8T0LN38_9STRA|nr:hypothetical protein G195_009792 [Phytophthora kernoviae 00238/432]KAG2511632.1 hypothetical protein JM16_008201 [Phytophthora kernoviae]KAG2514563.1 hypothetical protein JM18_008319 [Phytophthora kernoviae]